MYLINLIIRRIATNTTESLDSSSGERGLACLLIAAVVSVGYLVIAPCLVLAIRPGLFKESERGHFDHFDVIVALNRIELLFLVVVFLHDFFDLTVMLRAEIGFQILQ